MTKITLEIEDCRTCPFHETTPYYTSDSFERATNWYCTHEKVMHQNDKRELIGKLVAGYVGTFEKVPVPITWCPVYVPEEGDVRDDGAEMFMDGEWKTITPSSTIPGAIDFTATDNNE